VQASQPVAAAAAAVQPPAAPQGAAQSEWLRNVAAQLHAALGQAGERESVLALIRQLSVAEPTSVLVPAQSLAAGPSSGPLLVYPSSVGQAAAASAPAPLGMSVHTPVVSVVHSAVSRASAASSRTPIMRHAEPGVADDIPFTVSPDKAYKAPDLTEPSNYNMWRTAFFSWLGGYGIAELVTSGPRYIVLPTEMEQLSAEERSLGVAGYELQQSHSSADAAFRRRAQIEFDKCAFIAQALLRAVQKVPLAASVVASTPPPNALEMMRKLESLMQPHTVAALQSAEQEFALMEQRKDEDISSYGARAQTLFNQLVRLGSTHSVHQRCLAWTRGLVSLTQQRRDLLMVLLPQTPTFEALMASARQFEQEDVAQQRLLQRGRPQPQQPPQQLAFGANSSGDRLAERDFSQYTCHSCNKRGHIAHQCTERSEESRRADCGWCGTHGQPEPACRKKPSGLHKVAPQSTAAAQEAAAAKAKQALYAAGWGPQANLFERAPVSDAAADLPFGAAAGAASGGGDRLRVQTDSPCCA